MSPGLPRPPPASFRVKFTVTVTVARPAGGAAPAAGLRLELQAAAILFDTDDRREGMRAFIDKRAPVFHGR